jgi:hypothetical protein
MSNKKNFKDRKVFKVETDMTLTELRRRLKQILKKGKKKS